MTPAPDIMKAAREIINHPSWPVGSSHEVLEIVARFAQSIRDAERSSAAAEIERLRALVKEAGEFSKKPTAYMVHNPMMPRSVNLSAAPSGLSEKTVWFYPAGEHARAKEAARTLRANLTPLYARRDADEEKDQ